jgi:diphosphomevalonate decarboxylase
MNKATFRVGSNIAFIKYWGVSDPTLNIPLNNSISMTLADAHTTTTVAWDVARESRADTITLDGEELSPSKARRIVEHLDRLRALAGINYCARVASWNNFPTASGIASSASGFAALTVAGCAALGLDWDATRLSAIARQGSGSASRSLFGGFVEWHKGSGDGDSIARQIYPPDHWDLRDIVAVVSGEEKKVSSANGHLLALTSPLVEARSIRVTGWLDEVRQALADRNITQLGPAIELDALTMHSVMMTSQPSLLYWQPGTLAILHAVQRWREDDGLPVYFTIDAGPNVHLICEADIAREIESRLAQIDAVESVITSHPGPGPQVMDEHLF